MPEIFSAENSAPRTVPPTAPQIAPLWMRSLALLLDGIIWVSLVFAVAIIPSGYFLMPLYLVAGLTAFVAYQVILHALYGATIGKMILRLRVVRADNFGPIDTTMAIKRSFVDAVLRLSMGTIAAMTFLDLDFAPPKGDILPLLKILQARPSYLNLSNIGTFWAISEIFTCLFHPLRRSLHDLIGGTVVVRLPKG